MSKITITTLVLAVLIGAGAAYMQPGSNEPSKASVPGVTSKNTYSNAIIDGKPVNLPTPDTTAPSTQDQATAVTEEQGSIPAENPPAPAVTPTPAPNGSQTVDLGGHPPTGDSPNSTSTNCQSVLVDVQKPCK